MLQNIAKMSINHTLLSDEGARTEGGSVHVTPLHSIQSDNALSRNNTALQRGNALENIALSDTSAIFGGGVNALWGAVEAQPNKIRKRKKLSRFERKLGSNAELPVRMQLSIDQISIWADAQRAYVEGDYEKAMQNCIRISIEVPLFPYAYQLMGMIYESTGDLDNALEMFNYEANINTRSKGLLKKVGYMALHIRKYDIAFFACKKALTFVENRLDADLYSLKTLLCVYTQQISAAERSLKHAVTKFPDKVDMYADFADACFEVNRPDKGVIAYTHYICAIVGVDYSYFEEKGKRNQFQWQGSDHLVSGKSSNDVDYPKLFHAARVSIDVLLRGIPGEDASDLNHMHALFITMTVTEYILKLRKQTVDVTDTALVGGDVPSIPLDLAILFALSRLHAKDNAKANIAIALSMIRPILNILDSADEASAARSITHRRNMVSSGLDQLSTNAFTAAEDSELQSTKSDENVLNMPPEQFEKLRHINQMEFQNALYTQDITKTQNMNLDVFFLLQRTRLADILYKREMHTLARKVLAKVIKRLPFIEMILQQMACTKEKLEEKHSRNDRRAVIMTSHCTYSASELYLYLGKVCLNAHQAKDACAMYWKCLELNKRDAAALSGLAFIAFHRPQDFVYPSKSESLSSFATRCDLELSSPRVYMLENMSRHFMQLVEKFEGPSNSTCSAFERANSSELKAPTSGKDSKNGCDGKKNTFRDDASDVLDGSTHAPEFVEENLQGNEIDDGCGNYDGRADVQSKLEAFSDTARNGYDYDSLTVGTIRAELRAIVAWADYLLDVKGDVLSFLSIALPILEAWATGINIRGRPLRAFSNIVDDFALPYDRSHVLVYMNELKLCVPSLTYERRHWLDKSHNDIWRLIKCMCYFEPVEFTFGKCRLKYLLEAVGRCAAASMHDKNNTTFEQLSAELLKNCEQHFPSNEDYKEYIQAIEMLESQSNVSDQCVLTTINGINSSNVKFLDAFRKVEFEFRRSEQLSNITVLHEHAADLREANQSSRLTLISQKALDCPFSSESDSDLSDIDIKHVTAQVSQSAVKPFSLSTYEKSESDSELKGPSLQRKHAVQSMTSQKPPANIRTDASVNPNHSSRFDKMIEVAEVIDANNSNIQRMADVHTMGLDLAIAESGPLRLSDKSDIELANEISHQAMDKFLQNPQAYVNVNVVFREFYSLPDGNSIFPIPAESLYNRFPQHLVPCLLAGHECLRKKQYDSALQKYLDAQLLDPLQPLPYLCLSNVLAYMAHCNIGGQSLECYTKALAFMSKYNELRLINRGVFSSINRTELNSLLKTNNSGISDTSDTYKYINAKEKLGEKYITQLLLSQESLYNLGRTFHENKLYSLAIKNYLEALEIGDARRDSSVSLRPSASNTILHLSRDIAHNLVTIYKLSNSTDAALQVMQRYLVI